MKTLLSCLITIAFSPYHLKAESPCHIELHPYIYSHDFELREKYILSNNNMILGQKLNPLKVIKQSDCPKELNKNLSQRIIQLEGAISSDLLVDYSQKNIIITPNKIKVTNLMRYMKKALKLQKNKVVRLRETVQFQLPITSQEPILIKCQNCSDLGEHTLKVQSQHTHWLRIAIYKKMWSLIASERIRAHELDYHKKLKYDWILTDRPEDLVSDKSLISYHLPIRPIKAQAALSHFDLGPKKLIHPGQKVRANVYSSGLSVQTYLVSKQIGHYGKVISLFNPKTRKEVNGKVIGQGAVKVDL